MSLVSLENMKWACNYMVNKAVMEKVGTANRKRILKNLKDFAKESIKEEPDGKLYYFLAIAEDYQ